VRIHGQTCHTDALLPACLLLAMTCGSSTARVALQRSYVVTADCPSMPPASRCRSRHPPGVGGPTPLPREFIPGQQEPTDAACHCANNARCVRPYVARRG
jgi:hypothetical protein